VTGTVDFWGDLHINLDTGILFRYFFLFRVRKILLLFYCSLGERTIMLVILVMNLISILCDSLTLRVKTYSLVEVCTVVSTVI